MKEYVIPASQFVSGYRQVYRTRTKRVDSSGTTYSNWSYTYTSVEDSSNNKVNYRFYNSNGLIDSGTGYAVYQETQTLQYLGIDLTFDISGVPANRIQSVSFRAKLTGKDSNVSNLGYYISSVGDTGGVFDSDHPHFVSSTQLGDCSLNSIPDMPYTHDTVLSGLSNTGWYTMWNDPANGYDNGNLAFDMSSFYLVITTDEESVVTYTITYDKGTYGTGTNTTDTKTAGAAIVLEDALFTREDYTQTGWSINADGSTKDYNLGANYTTDANITLYPYWTAGHVATGNVLFIMTESGLQPII